MMQGINATEATELAKGLFSERSAIIRGAGLKKIFMGIPMMAFPVVTWIYMVVVYRFLFVKLWALTLMVGIYGMYCFFKGLIMFFSPGSEPGDVSEK